MTPSFMFATGSGFTWYSLTDQVDWDIALRENKGTVNPLGLYDLDRQIRGKRQLRFSGDDD